jgi:hypothetical protein
MSETAIDYLKSLHSDNKKVDTLSAHNYYTTLKKPEQVSYQLKNASDYYLNTSDKISLAEREMALSILEAKTYLQNPVLDIQSDDPLSLLLNGKESIKDFIGNKDFTNSTPQKILGDNWWDKTRSSNQNTKITKKYATEVAEAYKKVYNDVSNPLGFDTKIKYVASDTEKALHTYNDTIFIKSYGVKTGLIIVFCVNVDGKLVPYHKTKIKKNVTSISLVPAPTVEELRTKLTENVDVEAIHLLYKQAIKVANEFTTKEKTLEWFIKKQADVIDINHLLKIDNVLITVI